jgi:hypothetical protein
MAVRSLRRSSRVLAVALGGLALAVPVAAAAESVLTPAGPATLRGAWFGPVPAIGMPPQVVVGWTVTVGPGGNAGPVHLQVVDGADSGTVAAASPTVQLPAAPGTYTFALPAGQGLRSVDTTTNLALAQEVGGHAILRTVDAQPENGPMADPALLSAVDLWTPALADDARDVPRTERTFGRQLAVTLVSEADVDQDGLGDKTQDVGDLRILSATIADRLADRALVAVRVRNVGSTVRHRPTLSVPGLPFMPCWAGACGTASPLAPGAEADLSLWVDTTTSGLPTLAVVGDEGVDVNPADNRATITSPHVAKPTPRELIRLQAVPSAAVRSGGLRVSLGAAQAGPVRVSVRAAGLTFGRTIRFAKADRRTITLTPASRKARRHLAAALRRPGRISAKVTARWGTTTTAVTLKV